VWKRQADSCYTHVGELTGVQIELHVNYLCISERQKHQTCGALPSTAPLVLHSLLCVLVPLSLNTNCSQIRAEIPSRFATATCHFDSDPVSQLAQDTAAAVPTMAVCTLVKEINHFEKELYHPRMAASQGQTSSCSGPLDKLMLRTVYTSQLMLRTVSTPGVLARRSGAELTSVY
jgi:hypothetical protein